MTRLALIIGKLVANVSRVLHFGAGATWPGEIALTLYPSILTHMVQHIRHGIIIVAGTNGKTTTSLMIKKILEQRRYRVIHNASGANLLNGIVSACIGSASWTGNVRADWGVFEVDENSLPRLLDFITPKTVVILNLFRDQLDRYGEVDMIAQKWRKALQLLSKESRVILNCDDPQIAYLGSSLTARVSYFGIDDKRLFQPVMEHATDSTFCLSCGNRLTYEGTYFSHLGVWRCDYCGRKRPKPLLSHWKSTLPGVYNLYNTLAAVMVGRSVGISDSDIAEALSCFTPAFGRQEEFAVGKKHIKIFLSKNPAGFNASLRTVLDLKPKILLLLLNDRIPDGRDVSWIWDVDFEMIPTAIRVIVGGDRVYDMSLRIKYTRKTQNSKLKIQNLTAEPNLNKAICTGLNQIHQGETLYILPTYSAMLEVRKLLSGRKIL